MMQTKNTGGIYQPQAHCIAHHDATPDRPKTFGNPQPVGDTSFMDIQHVQKPRVLEAHRPWASGWGWNASTSSASKAADLWLCEHRGWTTHTAWCPNSLATRKFLKLVDTRACCVDEEYFAPFMDFQRNSSNLFFNDLDSCSIGMVHVWYAPKDL